MRKLSLAAVAALALSVTGCASFLPSLTTNGVSGTGTVTVPASTNKFVTLACQIDGVAQPIASGVLSAVGPIGALVAAFDNGVIHPMVLDYCASKNGLVVKVTGSADVTATPKS